MKIGVVILCRYESKRLPGKILREIRGLSLLGHIVARIKFAVPELPVVVATSSETSDDPIVDYCRRAKLDCFRGSLSDVSDRFLSCLQGKGWDFGVRINGDNLFLDPDTLRVMCGIAQTNGFDLITNVPGRSFPKGMSIEVLRTSFYAKARDAGFNSEHQEHVTTWFYENPNFGIRYVYPNCSHPEAGGYPLAIDTEADLIQAEQIFKLTGLHASASGLSSIWRAITQEKVTLSPWRGRSGPLLIAEVGGNHEGNFNYAKQLTRLAIESGADCVKFQIYRGDTLVSRVETPDRHRHFQRFELQPNEHIELAQMCRDAGVAYMASVWDLEMLEWIEPYIDIYKVGSGDLTAWPILRELARRKKPILLSTGLSTLDEVLQTVRQVQAVNPCYLNPEWLCILQCTSMYPIPDQDANLRTMTAIREFTGLAVGYSDHTVGQAALRAAATMGAEVLEFHFTDSREGKNFRDHQVSLTKDEVLALKENLNQISNLLGNGIKVPQPSELASGHEISFRRGVYANRLIQAGETIQESDLVLLRPALGTDARDFERVVGAVALRDILPYAAMQLGQEYSGK